MFGYPANNNRIANEVVNGTTVRTFTHDGAGRLTRIIDGSAIDLTYTLNAAGEVIETDYNAPLVPSAAPGTNTFTFDKAAQIISTGFTHDARGRRTASPSGVFAWGVFQTL